MVLGSPARSKQATVATTASSPQHGGNSGTRPFSPSNTDHHRTSPASSRQQQQQQHSFWKTQQQPSSSLPVWPPRDARQASFSPGRVQQQHHDVRHPSPQSSNKHHRTTQPPPSPETQRQRARIVMTKSPSPHLQEHRQDSWSDEWFAVSKTTTMQNYQKHQPSAPSKPWGEVESVRGGGEWLDVTDVDDSWRFSAAEPTKSHDSGEHSLYDDTGERIIRVMGTTTADNRHDHGKVGSPSRPISIHDLEFLDERDQGILEAAHSKSGAITARDQEILQRAAAKRLSADFSTSSVDSKKGNNKKKGGGIMGFFRGTVSLIITTSGPENTQAFAHEYF